MSIFDKHNLSSLQRNVLSGNVDSDNLLKELMEWIDTKYYNLFCNLSSGERTASPVSRKGNSQFALRQSFKSAALKKMLKKTSISFETSSGIYSHLFFLTLTVDHKVMSRDEANQFITSKGKGISRFFARFEKHIDGGYSKVLVKESTKSGYPAVHIILHLEKPLKIKYHRKSKSYRPDPSDQYTKKVLSKWKNLNDWNSKSPIWNVGFIDIYGFTSEDMSIKSYANPINYISKYITKSLNITEIKKLGDFSKISELPPKYRTEAWTILNCLIWNSHTWVISKDFKNDMKFYEKKIRKSKGRWLWVDAVHKDSPRLREWLSLTDTALAQVMLNPV